MATTKTEPVVARVPESTKRKIARLAEEEKRTISNLATILLEEALQARKSKEAA